MEIWSPSVLICAVGSSSAELDEVTCDSATEMLSGVTVMPSGTGFIILTEIASGNSCLLPFTLQAIPIVYLPTAREALLRIWKTPVEASTKKHSGVTFCPSSTTR